jgi:hypothetical protein
MVARVKMAAGRVHFHNGRTDAPRASVPASVSASALASGSAESAIRVPASVAQYTRLSAERDRECVCHARTHTHTQTETIRMCRRVIPDSCACMGGSLLSHVGRGGSTKRAYRRTGSMVGLANTAPSAAQRACVDTTPSFPSSQAASMPVPAWAMDGHTHTTARACVPTHTRPVDASTAAADLTASPAGPPPPPPCTCT